jgi:hypothetical protein
MKGMNQRMSFYINVEMNHDLLFLHENEMLVDDTNEVDH